MNSIDVVAAVLTVAATQNTPAQTDADYALKTFTFIKKKLEAEDLLEPTGHDNSLRALAELSGMTMQEFMESMSKTRQ